MTTTIKRSRRSRRGEIEHTITASLVLTLPVSSLDLDNELRNFCLTVRCMTLRDIAQTELGRGMVIMRNDLEEVFPDGP